VYALEAILSHETPELFDLYTVACRESPPSAYSEFPSGNKCTLPHWPPLDEAKTPTVDQWSVDIGAAVVAAFGIVVDGDAMGVAAVENSASVMGIAADDSAVKGASSAVQLTSGL
jgi:hypothetical protein